MGSVPLGTDLRDRGRSLPSLPPHRVCCDIDWCLCSVRLFRWLNLFTVMTNCSLESMTMLQKITGHFSIMTVQNGELGVVTARGDQHFLRFHFYLFFFFSFFFPVIQSGIQDALSFCVEPFWKAIDFRTSNCTISVMVTFLKINFWRIFFSFLITLASLATLQLALMFDNYKCFYKEVAYIRALERNHICSLPLPELSTDKAQTCKFIAIGHDHIKNTILIK